MMSKMSVFPDDLTDQSDVEVSKDEWLNSPSDDDNIRYPDDDNTNRDESARYNLDHSEYKTFDRANKESYGCDNRSIRIRAERKDSASEDDISDRYHYTNQSRGSGNVGGYNRTEQHSEYKTFDIPKKECSKYGSHERNRSNKIRLQHNGATERWKSSKHTGAIASERNDMYGVDKNHMYPAWEYDNGAETNNIDYPAFGYEQGTYDDIPDPSLQKQPNMKYNAVQSVYRNEKSYSSNMHSIAYSHDVGLSSVNPLNKYYGDKPERVRYEKSETDKNRREAKQTGGNDGRSDAPDVTVNRSSFAGTFDSIHMGSINSASDIPSTHKSKKQIVKETRKKAKLEESEKRKKLGSCYILFQCIYKQPTRDGEYYLAITGDIKDLQLRHVGKHTLTLDKDESSDFKDMFSSQYIPINLINRGKTFHFFFTVIYVSYQTETEAKFECESDTLINYHSYTIPNKQKETHMKIQCVFNDVSKGSMKTLNVSVKGPYDDSSDDELI